MLVVNAILHLTVPELVAAGISQSTVLNAKANSSMGWAFMDDPNDRRRVLVAWPLKEPYRTQVLEHYGEPHLYHRAGHLESILPLCDDDRKTLADHTTETGTTLGLAKQKELHETARWMRLCATIRSKAGDSILAAMGMSKPEFWDWLPTYIKARNAEDNRTAKVKLPNSYAKLLAKVRRYETEGVKSLIHGNVDNDNSAKLCEDARMWILSTYALVTKPEIPEVAFRYALEAKRKGWEMVGESCIYMYLNRPEVKRVWYLARHGYKAWKQVYEHNLKLFLPTFRDALWVMDGTKVNLFYRDEKGMAAKLQINKVTDAYSECIIGYDVMFSENHVSAYVGLKRAVQFSMAKPFQVLYDGQGGYKKAEIQGLMSNLSSVHFAAQPYNAQSKHVEGIIKRFQTQVMRKHWYFTGQNIQAKKEDSKPNYDFIMAHVKDLPTLEDVTKRIIPEMVEEWNNGKHPLTGVSRVEMYHTSTNPDHTEIGYLDMVDIFWLERKETYRKDGIHMEVAKRKYTFEVMGDDGLPCAKHLERYTGAELIVKYDPEDMGHIRLHVKDASGDLRFVAAAYTKKEFARAVVDLKPGMRTEIDEHMQFRKDQKATAKRIIDEANAQSGISSEMLIGNGYAMGNKDAMNDAEEDFQLVEAGAAYVDVDAERRARAREKFNRMNNN